MEIDILTRKELEGLKSDLINAIKEAVAGKTDNSTKSWLRTSDVRKLLGISGSSIQNLRNTGKLKYSKVGGSIFYKAEDVTKLLEENIKGLSW